jgi:hypothetical protein
MTVMQIQMFVDRRNERVARSNPNAVEYDDGGSAGAEFARAKAAGQVITLDD